MALEPDYQSYLGSVESRELCLLEGVFFRDHENPVTNINAEMAAAILISHIRVQRSAHVVSGQLSAGDAHQVRQGGIQHAVLINLGMGLPVGVS